MCLVFSSLSEFSSIVIHAIKGFGIVNKAEIDGFLEFSFFFHDAAVPGSSPGGSRIIQRGAAW